MTASSDPGQYSMSLVDTVMTYKPLKPSLMHKTYETLCSIIHEAELEALLIFKGLGQSMTQGVWWQSPFSTLLELTENALQKEKEAKHVINLTTQKCRHFCFLQVLLCPTAVSWLSLYCSGFKFKYCTYCVSCCSAP